MRLAQAHDVQHLVIREHRKKASALGVGCNCAERASALTCYAAVYGVRASDGPQAHPLAHSRN